MPIIQIMKWEADCDKCGYRYVSDSLISVALDILHGGGYVGNDGIYCGKCFDIVRNEFVNSLESEGLTRRKTYPEPPYPGPYIVTYITSDKVPAIYSISLRETETELMKNRPVTKCKLEEKIIPAGLFMRFINALPVRAPSPPPFN